MFRALLWKELRSCAPWALLSTLVMGWMIVASLTDFRSDPLRELDLFRFDLLMGNNLSLSSFYRLFAAVLELSMGSILLGIVLGLWQSVPESVSGIDSFLAHTGRSRQRVFWAKAAAGGMIMTGTFFVPLGIVTGIVMNRLGEYVPVISSDAQYIWMTASTGWAAYLGVLGAGLRGAPWREGFRQLAGIAVVAAGATAAAAFPSFFWPAMFLTLTFAAAWGLCGYLVREF